jgi:hypothetical protein
LSLFVYLLFPSPSLRPAISSLYIEFTVLYLSLPSPSLTLLSQTSPPPSLPASYHTLRWSHPPQQLSIEERQEQRILSALAHPFGRRYIQRKLSREAFKTLDVNTREQVGKIVKDRKDKGAKKALRRLRASRRMQGSEDEVEGKREIDSQDEGGRDKSGRS